MSEFLRKHLADLKQLREQLLHEEADGFIINSLSYLIANVEAHQKVITLKKRPKYDFPKAKEIAREQGIQLMPKEGYIDKLDMEEQFRKKGLEIPTLPTIYNNKRLKAVQDQDGNIYPIIDEEAED